VSSAWQQPEELATSCSQSRYNYIVEEYPKAHWIDSACAGPSGSIVSLNPQMQILQVTACSRQSRRMVRPDKFSFPNGKPKTCSAVQGFRTGDIARATVIKGTKKGTWIGRVAVRASGSFRVGHKDGISAACLTKIQSTDGYNCSYKTKPNAFLPALKGQVSNFKIR
jgi:hypothetical protein